MCNPDVVGVDGTRESERVVTHYRPPNTNHTHIDARAHTHRHTHTYTHRHTHTIYGESITSIKTPIQRTTLWLPSCLWKLLPCPPSSLAKSEDGCGEDCLLREQELSWNIFWSQGLRDCELFSGLTATDSLQVN